MNELFDLYRTFLTARLQAHGSFNSFGEDSIRYDFYIALMRLYGLEPHQIILEQPIPPTQFNQREREILRGRGRHEDKPEFDLRVDPAGLLNQGLIVEFGYFRAPELASNQDKSGKHGKLLNELFRLALLKNFALFNNYRCMFICVTDSDMINYGARGVQGPQALPIQGNYILDDNFLRILSDTSRKKIQDKFYDRTLELNIIPTAQRIILLDTPANNFIGQWQLWAWEVDYINTP
jgi:hypothetical protein